MILRVLRLYLANREERVPHQKAGPFKTDTGIYRQPPDSGLRITWLGHSSMLIEMDGMRVLVDPVWDQRASPIGFLGPKRFFEAPLNLSQLPDLDVVLISHNHYDHLGKQTIKELANLTQAKWITSLGVGDQLRRFGVRAEAVTEMDWTDSIEVKGLKITALPARHFSGRGIGDRFESLWSSFVLTGDRHNIYFGADSGMWPGFKDIGREYGPFDLTMLEVGAYNELWESIHMGPDGAVQAFIDMGGFGLLMPIHWGLFDLALHGWKQPMERIIELADKHQLRIWSPTPGVPTEVNSNVALQSIWWQG